MWKQGEGQIQYMDQNEGRGLFFLTTRQNQIYNITGPCLNKNREIGTERIVGSTETAGGHQTGQHTSQGKG